MPTFPIIQTFSNKTSSTIDYSPAIKAVLGEYPNVDVMYWDKIAHEYVMSNIPASRMEFRGNEIVIFHGGAESGILKVY